MCKGIWYRWDGRPRRKQLDCTNVTCGYLQTVHLGQQQREKPLETEMVNYILQINCGVKMDNHILRKPREQLLPFSSGRLYGEPQQKYHGLITGNKTVSVSQENGIWGMVLRLAICWNNDMVWLSSVDVVQQKDTHEHESVAAAVGKYGPSYHAETKATTISGKNKENVIRLVWVPEHAGLEGNGTGQLKREVY